MFGCDIAGSTTKGVVTESPRTGLALSVILCKNRSSDFKNGAQTMSGEATEELSGAGDLQSENASKNGWTILLCRWLVIRDVMEVQDSTKLL